MNPISQIRSNHRFHVEKFFKTNTNLAMTIVGYGKDYWGTPHWILKNSWGTEWGENGESSLFKNLFY